MPNDPTRVVKESHFIHAHFLRKDTDGKYIMTFKGCDFELPLPAPPLKLYSMRSLNFQLEPLPQHEPRRNSVAGVMTHAQRRRAEEQIRRDYEDAQQSGAEPAWAHPSAEPAWESQGGTAAWDAQTGSWHTSWDSIVPSAHPTQSSQHYSGGEYSYGHGAGPSHSARYTSYGLEGDVNALFGALDLQEHRTLGMIDNLNQIQDQQGATHNMVLETRATVERMQEQNLQYYNWQGFFPQ